VAKDLLLNITCHPRGAFFATKDLLADWQNASFPRSAWECIRMLQVEKMIARNNILTEGMHSQAKPGNAN